MRLVGTNFNWRTLLAVSTRVPFAGLPTSADLRQSRPHSHDSGLILAERGPKLTNHCQTLLIHEPTLARYWPTDEPNLPTSVTLVHGQTRLGFPISPATSTAFRLEEVFIHVSCRHSLTHRSCFGVSLALVRASVCCDTIPWVRCSSDRSSRGRLNPSACLWCFSDHPGPGALLGGVLGPSLHQCGGVDTPEVVEVLSEGGSLLDVDNGVVYDRQEVRSAGNTLQTRRSGFGYGRNHALPAPILAARPMFQVPTRCDGRERDLQAGKRSIAQLRALGALFGANFRTSGRPYLTPCRGPRELAVTHTHTRIQDIWELETWVA